MWNCCSPGGELFEELGLHDPTNPPAVGYLGGDSNLEIVAGTYNSNTVGEIDEVQVAMTYRVGSTQKAVLGSGVMVMPGRRPAGSSSLGYPLLVDWDGDETTEIMIGSDQGTIFCWEPVWDSGTQTFSLLQEKGWPILHRGTHGSLAVADLDGDGFLELVVPSDDGHVYAYDLPGSTAEWSQAGYDLARTGFVPPSGSRPDGPTAEEVEDNPAIDVDGANPFRDAIRIRFRHVDEGPADASVYDVAGRRVRGLLDEAALSRGVHELSWDGRDDSGAKMAAGVYFVRIISGRFELVRRVVQVR